MRTITKTLLAFGLVAGAATLGIPGAQTAHAQGFYIDTPGIHVGVGERRHYRHYRRYYRGYDTYGYAGRPYYYGGNAGGNCRIRGWTVQDGVCKPYRGY
jgi:hypothetical protein